MTATPDRMDGKNIRDIFGDEVYSFPLAEALVHGQWLADVDYRVVADDVDRAALDVLLKQIRSDQGVRITGNHIDKTVFLVEKLDVQAKLIREIQADGDKKTIVFCRDIVHLGLIQERLPDYIPYHTGMDKRVLKHHFNAFENGTIRKLLVIDKFNEAVDVPDAELIVFLRATESKTIWLQQLGRGLRKPNGKKTVVVLDFIANCDRVKWINQFTEDVDDAAKPPKDDDVEPRERVRAKLTTGWRVTLSQDVRDILEVLSKGDHDWWNQKIEDLRVYKARHGDLRVPKHWKENPKLARWVQWLRGQRKNGLLDSSLVAKLDAMGFEWTPRELNDKRLKELQSFKTKYGHCRVPTRWSENLALAAWINRIRCQRKNGLLDSSLVAKLDAMGFEWTPRELNDKRLKELQSFKTKYGHCRVPLGWPENPLFSWWIVRIRRQNRAGTLSDELREKLDFLGFDWNPPKTPINL